MSYSDAQRRACKKYYETHRDKIIEKSKLYSKSRYVKQKTKTEYRDDFLHEIVPLIEEYLSEVEEKRLDTVNGERYINFRKIILQGETPLEEVYVLRERNNITEGAWFYKKCQWKKRKGDFELNDWIMVDYSKQKNTPKNK